MTYIRKTKDEYHVMGDYGYGHGYETVTIEETYKEARVMKKCYMENEPGIRFKVVTKRVKI